MITEIRLRDFKSFEDATLRLGPFTVLVGANASGKSNIRDAFRFLHGIGRGYSVAEIIGGKYGAGGELAWEPLRGGANEIIRFGANRFLLDVGFSLGGASNKPALLGLNHYRIGITRSIIEKGSFQVCDEALKINNIQAYQVLSAGKELEGLPQLRLQLSKNNQNELFDHNISLPATHPMASQIASLPSIDREHHLPAQGLLTILGSMRFLDFIPEQMRRAAFPGQAIIGDSGENLPMVLSDICDDPNLKSTLIDWIQELTPMDVVDFEFPRDPTSGLIQLILKERSGHRVSAYSASDGTLRFLTLLAALLSKRPARLYFFEDIEAGIHPSRLRLLIELIETQTANNNIQVITTTHSPYLLEVMSEATFNNASVIYRARNDDHSIIRPISELPNVPALRAQQGLGPLHSSGWMEDALFFADEHDQAIAK